MKKIILILTLFTTSFIFAQVKIGDDVTNLNANSLLELESTNKGLLLPRVALTNTTAFGPLTAHVQGMTVYNTATAGDVTPGIYTNSGTAWVRVGSGGAVAYENIGGGVQPMFAGGTIADTTYFVVYASGSPAGTLITPTPVAGKTIHVRNNSINFATVAGVNIGGGKGRTFVCDGATWHMLTP